jgi:hypothetical protein
MCHPDMKSPVALGATGLILPLLFGCRLYLPPVAAFS